MLQIDAAAADPITRTAALLSLICGLMSLLFGCMYIIRFGTMRKPYKAASWAEEAQKTKTSIAWNVWVMLAIPAAWLAWSILLFITCIMAFVWRTGAGEDPPVTTLSPHARLALRLAVTVVFALGVIYFVLIVTTFRRYGDAMDAEWRQRVMGWAKEGPAYTYVDRPSYRSYAPSSLPRSSWSPRRAPPIIVVPPNLPPFRPSSVTVLSPTSHSVASSAASAEKVPPPTSMEPNGNPAGRRVAFASSSETIPPEAGLPSAPVTAALTWPRAFSRRLDFSLRHPPFKTAKVVDLRFLASAKWEMPEVLREHDVVQDDWDRFVLVRIVLFLGYIYSIQLHFSVGSIKCMGWNTLLTSEQPSFSAPTCRCGCCPPLEL